MASKVALLPTGAIPWTDPATGKPSDSFRLFMTLFAVGNIGPLTAAANDTAAALAGVSVGQLYQASGVVRIRLT